MPFELSLKNIDLTPDDILNVKSFFQTGQFGFENFILDILLQKLNPVAFKFRDYILFIFREFTNGILMRGIN